MTDSKIMPNSRLFLAFKGEGFGLVLFFKNVDLRDSEVNIKNTHEISNASYIF